MSDRAKRIIFIIAFILVTITLGYLLYYLFLRPVPTTPPANGNINEAAVNGLPQANININKPVYINVNGQLVPAENINTNQPSTISSTAKGGLTETTTLVNKQTAGATLAGNGKDLLYYDKDEGKFYKIDANGKATLLTNKVFYNVDTITWAPSKEKVVLEYPDGSNILFNFTTDKQITLPKQWKDFSFSPDSSQIALKNWTADKEDRYLMVAKDDGSSPQRTEFLNEKDTPVHVDWSPNDQVVATYNSPLDAERQYLYFLGKNQERFPATIIEGWDYRSAWSPDGERLLYSVYNGQSNLNPMLWIVNGKGENMATNRVPLYLQTWADKCTFADSNVIYCAVPKSLQRGSGIIPTVADSVADDFYKIDLRTYSKTLIATTDQSYNAQDLTVTEDGKYLYFTNKNTGNLEQIKLK